MEKITEWAQKTSDIVGDLGPYVTPIIKILLLLFIGWFVLLLVKLAVGFVLRKISLDDKIAKWLGKDSKGFEKSILKFVSIIGWFLIIVIALDFAGVSEGVTKPLTNMLNDVLAFIPKLIAGILVLVLSIIIATIVKAILVNACAAFKLDERLGAARSNLGESLGLAEGEENSGSVMPITNSLGNVVYFIIILLMLPAVFGILQIPQLSDNITLFTEKIWDNLPNVMVAFIALAAGILIGNIVKNILANALPAVGFDSIPRRLGFNFESDSGKTPSVIIAFLAMISINIIFLAQALRIVNLEFLSELAEGLVPGYFRLLGAIIISLVGIWVANLVYNILAPRSAVWAKVAKIIILFFFAAMALQKANITPISNEIFENVINYSIIAAAFAFGIGGAIAFGLGGIDTVSRFLKRKFD